MTTLRSGSATDVGKVRTTNQDVSLEEPALFAVADGMGGHAGGEVAARVAVESLRAAFLRAPTVEGLRRAVTEANRAVWRQGQSESRLRGMGTTLTVTALVEEPGGRQVIALANVGDSRGYVYSRGQVIQVTADHSLAEEKVRHGQLTEAEAAVHPHRHVLTRALGISSDVEVDLWELHLHGGDRILLCSDGLTNEIGDDRIGQVLDSVDDPSDAAAVLVKAAVDHGGNDNVTCVVIDVVGPGPPPSGGVSAEDRTGASPIDRGAPPAATDAGAGADAGEAREGASAGARAVGATRVLRALDGDGGAPRGGARGAGGMLARSAGRANGGSTASSVNARGRDGAVRTAGAPTATTDRGAGPADAGPDGSGRAPGRTPAAKGLQASELRRLRSTRDDRRSRRRPAGVQRLVTVRLALFVVLLLAVIGAAYAALRWYSMDEWYVGIDHGHLAVYQGRPGGILWFHPRLVDDTPVTTHEVMAYRLPQLRARREEPSLAAARRYVYTLHEEYLTRSRSPVGSTSPKSGAQGH